MIAPYMSSEDQQVRNDVLVRYVDAELLATYADLDINKSRRILCTLWRIDAYYRGLALFPYETTVTLHDDAIKQLLFVRITKKIAV